MCKLLGPPRIGVKAKMMSKAFENLTLEPFGEQSLLKIMKILKKKTPCLSFIMDKVYCGVGVGERGEDVRCGS